MDFRDHQALVIDNWMGLWDRDDPQCPLDHLSTALNVEPVSGGVGIRSSFETAQALAAGVNVSQFQKFVRDVGQEGYIYFDENTRKMYHTGNHAPTVAIFTALANITGFSMICLFNRAYICFHDYSTGITGSRLKVYYERSTTITGTSAANPTTVTCAGEHGLQTGAVVSISGNATPAVNGVHTITVTGLTTFTIPVLGGGAGGTVSGWIFRDAMGAIPTVGTFAAAENAAAGVVTAGIHLFRVAYLTDTGFITKMSSAVQMTATGDKKVDLTNIPTGPAGAGITGRHIVATKAITAYDGNPDNYEFFFVTLIADNSTTSLSALNFFDSALVSSSDYLIDTLGSLPAPMGMCSYNGRVAYWGFPNDALSDFGYIYFSNQNDPEVISLADSVNKIPAGDGGSRGIFCCAEYRGSFYAFKRGKTYATIDNGDTPSTWTFQLVDAGFGCEALFGIARVEDSQLGIHRETLFVANFNGIYAFQGNFAERPLTWKIENIWREIPEGTFKRIKLAVQPTEQRIYVSYPTSYSAGEWPANSVYFGDYKLGLDFEQIRWFQLNFTGPNPTPGNDYAGISHISTETILAGLGVSRGLLVSFFGTAQPNLYRLTTTRSGNDALALTLDIKANLGAPDLDDPNDNFALQPDLSISHITAIRYFLRLESVTSVFPITLTGTLHVYSSDTSAFSPDISTIVNALGLPLNRTITVLVDASGERFQYDFSTSDSKIDWILQRLILYHNPLWESGEL